MSFSLFIAKSFCLFISILHTKIIVHFKSDPKYNTAISRSAANIDSIKSEKIFIFAKVLSLTSCLL